MRNRIFLLVSNHSFGYFQDDGIEPEGGSFKHAYLFVKIYQVGLIKFIFIDLI